MDASGLLAGRDSLRRETGATNRLQGHKMQNPAASVVHEIGDPPYAFHVNELLSISCRSTRCGEGNSGDAGHHTPIPAPSDSIASHR